jgi:hypothetical protein
MYLGVTSTDSSASLLRTARTQPTTNGDAIIAAGIPLMALRCGKLTEETIYIGDPGRTPNAKSLSRDLCNDRVLVRNRCRV